MDSFFNYPYRWQQILTQTSVSTQIQMLEERDRAIENYFFRDGRCPLEIPYRWDQIWEGILNGEAWAIHCAEENDRAVESLFAACECGSTPPPTGGYGYRASGEGLTGPAAYSFFDTLAQDATATLLQVSGYTGLAQTIIYRNGGTVGIFGPQGAPSSDPTSIAFSMGDLIQIEVTPFDAGPFDISVFLEMDTFTFDIFGSLS